MSADSSYVLTNIIEKSRQQDKPGWKPDEYFELFAAQQTLKLRRFNLEHDPGKWRFSRVHRHDRKVQAIQPRGGSFIGIEKEDHPNKMPLSGAAVAASCSCRHPDRQVLPAAV
jgi:hypothetical protein